MSPLRNGTTNDFVERARSDGRILGGRGGFVKLIREATRRSEATQDTRI
jgi:hypothetical protein